MKLIYKCHTRQFREEKRSDRLLLHFPRIKRIRDVPETFPLRLYLPWNPI